MRMITKHSPIRPTRIFFSHKNNAAYFMESGLEREFALYCEFNSKVRSYRCQPDPIYYSLPGETKRRRYTPDTLLEHVDLGLLIIEVKPLRHSLKPILQAKHERLREIYAENGIDFRVITERQIRDHYRIANYSRLYRFLRFEIDKGELEALKRHFPRGMYRNQVCELGNKHPFWPTTAEQALAHGLLKTDLSKELTPDTYMGWTA